MMITMTGPTPRTKPSPSLSVSRLRVLLDFLLGGSGGRSFGVSQKLIGCWTQEQRKALANRRWRWDTTGGARWVLTEREQNRAVTADAILDLSRRTLGPKSSLQTRLNWAVDFLLRHDLGLESRSKELRDLGSSVVSSTWDQVWAPHLGHSHAPSLLLLDEHSGHMTQDFLEPLQRSCTELVHVPAGCGFVVQPLDQCVAPVLRQFIKERWLQLVSRASRFSESDLVLTLSCWFSEVCHILNENKNFIQRSFVCIGSRYKTAEVSHQTLRHELHRVLVQTPPPPRPASQSESHKLQEEGLFLSPVSQSESLEVEKEVELHLLGQSGTEDAGLWAESQSDAVVQVEDMEEDQSEPQE